MSDPNHTAGVPPLGGTASTALRQPFSTLALETALAGHLSGLVGETVHPQRIPGGESGLSLRVGRFHPPLETEPAVWRLEAVLSMDSHLEAEIRERAGKVFAALPCFNLAAGGVLFRELAAAGDAVFAAEECGDGRRCRADIPLRVTADLAGSTFDAGEFEDEANWKAAHGIWGDLPLAALETALAGLLNQTGVLAETVAVGPLPPEESGVTLRVVKTLPLTATDYRDFEVEVAGRCADAAGFAAGFARLAGQLPLRRIAAGQFRIEALCQQGAAEFDGALRDGEEILEGVLCLAVRVRCDRSAWEPSGGGSEEPAVGGDPGTLPPLLEAALANWLNLQYGAFTAVVPGLLPSIAAGLSLRLTALPAPVSPRLRECEFVLSGRSDDRQRLARDMAGLLRGLPRRDFVCNVGDSSFAVTRARQRGRLEFTSPRLFGGVRHEATATLSVTVQLQRSTWNIASLPERAAPSAEPGFADLERAFAVWLADRLGHTVDGDLWRGGVPPTEEGLGVALQSAETHAASGCRRIVFALTALAAERDTVLEELQRVQALLPRFEVKLNDAVTLRALAEENAFVAPQADQGRAVWLGKLTLSALTDAGV